MKDDERFKNLERVMGDWEAKVARVDDLEAKVARMDDLEAKVARMDDLEAKVEKVCCIYLLFYAVLANLLISFQKLCI